MNLYNQYITLIVREIDEFVHKLHDDLDVEFCTSILGLEYDKNEKLFNGVKNKIISAKYNDETYIIKTIDKIEELSFKEKYHLISLNIICTYFLDWGRNKENIGKLLEILNKFTIVMSKLGYKIYIGEYIGHREVHNLKKKFTDEEEILQKLTHTIFPYKTYKNFYITISKDLDIPTSENLRIFKFNEFI